MKESLAYISLEQRKKLRGPDSNSCYKILNVLISIFQNKSDKF